MFVLCSNVAVSERFLMPGTPCNNYSVIDHVLYKYIMSSHKSVFRATVQLMAFVIHLEVMLPLMTSTRK